MSFSSIIQTLLSLFLILATQCQTQCGSLICQDGEKCTSQNRCVRNFIPSPMKLLQVFKAQQGCPATPCELYEICINKVCIDPKTSSQIPAFTPPRYGFLDRTASPYAMYYCDQNIYNLCGLFQKIRKPGWQGFAVIMSNKNHSFKLRMQRLGQNPSNNYRTTWNYHVIFIMKTGKQIKAYDFDNRLPWGVSFEEQWRRAIVTQPGQPTTFFRVIPYKNYLKYFSSTRSGMLQKQKDGSFKYKHPPPTRTFATNKLGLNNTLPRFVDFRFTDPEYGQIMSPNEFYRFITS